MKELRIKLIILIIVFIVMIFFGELAIRIYSHSTGKIIAMSDEELCNKGLFKIVSDINNSKRFFPSDTLYYEYYNYTGIRPKANLTTNIVIIMKFADAVKKLVYYDLYTNSKNIKALKDFNYTKNPSKFRIALLGNSFTWGADVSQKLSYASILEDLIPSSEVLNFGIEGIGIDTMYLRWKYEALRFNPEIVIFAIYIDNIARMRPCIHKPKFYVKNGQL